jgi:integrase
MGSNPIPSIVVMGFYNDFKYTSYATDSYLKTSEITLTEENPIPELGKEIDSLTEIDGYIRSLFRKIATANIRNAKILCEFVMSEYREQNLKLSSRQSHIKIMCLFDRFLNHKDFQEVSKNDVLEYLSSLKKSEKQDPSHKWVGTYNTRQTLLKKFFRWVYNRNEVDHQRWITPLCINGIRPLSRKEKSSYKPDDIWTNEEHSIYLKYCPEKRDRCFHCMANDTSARPHELLSIKIGDIKFKSSSTGTQYAEIHI